MQKKLKIIIFDGSFKTTPFVNRLVAGLSKDHTVYILGFNDTINNKVPNVNYIGLGSNTNIISFILISLKFAFYSKSIKTFLATVKQICLKNRKAIQQQNLQYAIKKIQPDIIHLQWTSVIPWFETILLQQKIPVVLSQRGYHINVRPFVNAENFEYLEKWYPKIAGFHSVSKAISKKGDEIFSSSTKNNKVVYSGLAIDSFKFTESYKKQTPLSLVSIGRSHWKKGYNYALQACTLLKERGVNFKFTIVGAFQDEELLYLRKLLQLEREVQFLDKLPQEKVFELVQGSQLMLLPSIEEGIANVAVEAMALGCPVISTNCGGMAELITHSKQGWLVPTRDSVALANEIEMFNGLSIESIQKVREAARNKVEKDFNESKMVEGMEVLYKCSRYNFPSIKC